MDTPEVATTVIQYAAQTGRLDLVSALLAVIGLLLGIGAIPVFLMLRMRAADVAREVAEEKLADAQARVERLAIERLEALLPSLVRDYMELAENSVTEDIADRIAENESKSEKPL